MMDADSDEAAFLRAIAADIENDAPRLVFADWLDEHGRGDEAAFIRLQCRLDLDRDRFDDPAINALRQRCEPALSRLQDGERRWLTALHEPLGHVRVVWRRGLVDSLELPAEWFVRFGSRLRERYPTLRKLVIFRLNGWGERLAVCPSLEGIREIELPCWDGDEDARALAASPYLSAVTRVVYWDRVDVSSELNQGRILATGSAWPSLWNLHAVLLKPDGGWMEAVNAAVDRPIGSAYRFRDELFSFAADFRSDFLVGRFPDGTLMIAHNNLLGQPRFAGTAFAADGTPRPEPFHWVFPRDGVHTRSGEEHDLHKDARVRIARRVHLEQEAGFTPALIRVKDFHPELGWIYRVSADAEDAWSMDDDPEVSADDDRRGPLGHGRILYDWVVNGRYVFADRSGEWHCDRTGHISSHV